MLSFSCLRLPWRFVCGLSPNSRRICFTAGSGAVNMTSMFQNHRFWNMFQNLRFWNIQSLFTAPKIMNFILFDDSIMVLHFLLWVLPVLSSSSCWKAYLLNRQTHFWGKHTSLHEKPLFRVHTPLKPDLLVLYSNFNRKLILSVHTPSLDGCLVWMADWLANWLAGCLGGWLADWLAVHTPNLDVCLAG